MANVVLSVDASARDCREDSLGGMFLSETAIPIGYFMVHAPQMLGLIFKPTTGDLSNLNGATGLSASIDFEPDVTDSGTFSGTFDALDTQSPSDFTTASNDLSGRTGTTATETWDATVWGTWTSGVLVTVNFVGSGLLDELVATYGALWTATDGIGFRWTGTLGNGERIARSWDHATAPPPQLTISYTPGGGGPVSTSPVPVVVTLSVPPVTLTVGSAVIAPNPVVAVVSIPALTVALGAVSSSPISVVVTLSIPLATVTLGAAIALPSPVSSAFFVQAATATMGATSTSPTAAIVRFAVPSVTVTIAGDPVGYILAAAQIHLPGSVASGIHSPGSVRSQANAGGAVALEVSQ